MCSGVIVMIRTITTWTVTSATIATGTFGRRRIRSSDVPVAVGTSSVVRDDVVGERVRVRPEHANDRSCRRPDEHDRDQVGAGEVGQPSAEAPARRRARAMGPTTAPNVAPHTTSPIAEARRSAGTGRRHVARQLVGALPKPISTVPSRSSGERPDDRGGRDERADDADDVARRPGRSAGRGGP